MTPQELEQVVLVAADVTQPQRQWEATNILTQWIGRTDVVSVGSILIQLLQLSQREEATFYCLTALQRLDVPPAQRMELRSILLRFSSPSSHMQVKQGVVLGRLILCDFVTTWNSAFDDLEQLASPTVYLRTLDALFEAGYSEVDPEVRKVKDTLRGLPGNGASPSMPIEQTISAQIIRRLLNLMRDHHHQDGVVNIAPLILTVTSKMISWIDLSLALQPDVMSLLFWALQQSAQISVLAMNCFSEVVARGMDAPKKVALLQDCQILENVVAHVNLDTLDASPIEVVIEVAKFVNLVGLELISSWEEQLVPDELWLKIVDLFFRCFAYDDIDVTGAVIPLASRMATNMTITDSPLRTAIPQLLGTMYIQMKYPPDFHFDYEDEDEAEEEVFRSELRRLNQRMVRSVPDVCLQFLCEALASLPIPISTSSTNDVEAALRLVFHFAEGIRPAPGVKAVMKKEAFVAVLTALHQSDISCHPHHEVLLLYYDITVRYATIFEGQPDLLSKALEALSGVRGIQHEIPRVRSRSCYLLQKLIKSLVKIMRPFVETAVTGIQGLLSNPTSHPLRSEDALYLFETIGILLGRTNLSEEEQHGSLTKVMAPHIQNIETILRSADMSQDPLAFGTQLAESIAAFSYLSKGFRSPPTEVQKVLLSALNVALSVFKALPSHEAVRKNCTGLWQRMTQCIGSKVLECTPDFLMLEIDNCVAEDVKDAAQMLNQCCIKFGKEAVPVLDGVLLPFLRKCLALVPTSPNGEIPPHLLTEQLSIKKYLFVVIQHIVSHKATQVLRTTRNAGSFADILKVMSDGAIIVNEAQIKKTCLQFFRELMEQWGETIHEEHGIEHILLRHVYETLIPGMFKCMLSSTFDESDAMQARSVTEVARILCLLKTKRGADEFSEYVLRGSFSSIGVPTNIQEAFLRAPDVKTVELCLTETMKVLKSK